MPFLRVNVGEIRDANCRYDFSNTSCILFIDMEQMFNQLQIEKYENL